MSRRGGSARKRRGGEEEPHHVDERWLITYADMITLLMALFIVMWAMSNVDATKFKALSASLSNAFSGKILPGANDIKPASAPDTEQTAPAAAPTMPGSPITQDPGEASKRAKENEEFAAIKAKLDAYAKANGLQNQMQARIARRGLVVSLLTDNVLFASGSAQLTDRSGPLLTHVSAAIRRSASKRPVLVEGHTDNVPVSTGAYPSNWELSTSRATSVVRYLIGHGMPAADLGAAGYADLHPLAPNTTDAGRARNRRVEIVLLRQGGGGADHQGGITP